MYTKMSLEKIVVFWFRRDLRVHDNHGLSKALSSGYKVVPLFVFDSQILEGLDAQDPRLSFIHRKLTKIHQRFKSDFKSSIYSYHGRPEEAFEDLAKTFDIQAIYTNRDYEPYAIKRDKHIAAWAKQQQINFYSFKDQVIFEENEVVKDNTEPYVVYTPYKNKWLQLFHEQFSNGLPIYTPSLENLHPFDQDLHPLEALGFEPSPIKTPDYLVSPSLIESYEDKRNFPWIEDGTSKLGPHLRFGTVSVRDMVKKAKAQNNQVFLSELIWREFFMQILWHFPETPTKAFKPAYDRIEWRNNKEEFEKWKAGQTGYPLVDAGMRELNTTGTMHNRVRMLVASFLCKHLLIDWRWGEAYFAEKLLDFELASNVGNWQWAAGSGVDAAPYFRIFNPSTQIDKFDKDHRYIKKWVTDLSELSYPAPMVDHKMARERCLTTYKKALA